MRKYSHCSAGSAATLAFGALLLTVGCSDTSPPLPAETQAAATEATSQEPGGQSADTQPSTLSQLPALEENRFDAVVKQVADREDPVLDGWSSEKFNEAAQTQLKHVGEAIAAPASLQDHHVFAQDFAAAALRPASLQSHYDDGAIEILRARLSAPDSQQNAQGALSAITQLFTGHSKVRSKFKTVRVELGDGTIVDPITRSHFQISGRNDQRSIQVNALWQCTWQRNSDPPLLKSIAVTEYEEVVHQLTAGRTLFSDCTQSIFRNGDWFDRQLAHGIDHWTDRFDGAIARPAAGHGIAIGDVNDDGLDDVYLCQSPALPNLLLIQQPDGTVIDTAPEAGVNWLEGTRAAILNDLDNDGDEDLVAVLGSNVVIQANDGTGQFALKAVVDTVSSLFAVNAVDYDNDSDLDLFICGYTLSSGVDQNDVFANPMPFEDATNGAPNVMLRNDGGWSFTDVTEEIGLGQNSGKFSYASSWDDYDSDGDLDCYVANDFGRNNLYRNDGGTFTDVAAALDIEDIGPGMSASWGDYNNDGHPDIYVSNMFSSAGNRITHNAQFKSDIDDAQKRDFQRHARGNSLFRNNGDGSFTDTSVASGVTLGRWAWGSVFADFNNDGWQDLYVTNGFITADDPDRDL
ncbi:MAG: hypothetical protein ACI9R3_001995 [Verrucomicrobiales bacterium]|jgi:hypothetical protein